MSFMDDLYSIMQGSWTQNWGGEDDTTNLVKVSNPNIVRCTACNKEIDITEEAHLVYGGYYCLREQCLIKCSAIKGIRVQLKEEIIIGDRDD